MDGSRPRSRFRFVQFVDELWSRAAQFCDILYNGIPLLRVPTGCTMEQAEIAPAFTNGVRGMVVFQQNGNDRVERQSCCIGANHIQHFLCTVLAQDNLAVCA